jgi:hypothetical protein
MLMGNEKGNMADVRAALGRDLEIGDIVDYTPFNSALAEMVPNFSPHWHIIETHPNGERTAAAHLVARRFGVFIPEIEDSVVKRGRKFDRTRLMFTGYIFVFVWDVMRHLSRIETIPGVARVMHSLVETRPAVMDERGWAEIYPAEFEERPLVISDLIIDEIRAVENEQRPLKVIMDNGMIQTKKKKGRWRKWLKQLEDPRDNDIVAVRPWSAFQDGLRTAVDNEARNQTLLKALSLT